MSPLGQIPIHLVGEGVLKHHLWLSDRASGRDTMSQHRAAAGVDRHSTSRPPRQTSTFVWLFSSRRPIAIASLSVSHKAFWLLVIAPDLSIRWIS